MSILHDSKARQQIKELMGRIDELESALRRNMTPEEVAARPCWFMEPAPKVIGRYIMEQLRKVEDRFSELYAHLGVARVVREQPPKVVEFVRTKKQ